MSQYLLTDYSNPNVTIQLHVSVVKRMQLNLIVIFMLIVAFTIAMITTVIELTEISNIVFRYNQHALYWFNAAGTENNYFELSKFSAYKFLYIPIYLLWKWMDVWRCVDLCFEKILDAMREETKNIIIDNKRWYMSKQSSVLTILFLSSCCKLRILSFVFVYFIKSVKNDSICSWYNLRFC